MGELFLILFFMYFVLLSGITTRVLGCDLQKRMKRSPIANHLILLFSVFFFTYVLNWYTFYGIGDTSPKWNMDDKHKENFENYSQLFTNEKIKYLYNGVLKSLLIYFIFILTTKVSGTFIWIFLIYCLFAIIMQIFLKSHNVSLYNYLNSNNIYYINDTSKLSEKFSKEKKMKEFIKLYNGLSISYGIILLLLFFNTFKYYLKKKKDYKKNFSIINFWLGTNKCKGNFI